MEQCPTASAQPHCHRRRRCLRCCLLIRFRIDRSSVTLGRLRATAVRLDLVHVVYPGRMHRRDALEELTIPPDVRLKAAEAGS